MSGKYGYPTAGKPEVHVDVVHFVADIDGFVPLLHLIGFSVHQETEGYIEMKLLYNWGLLWRKRNFFSYS